MSKEYLLLSGVIAVTLVNVGAYKYLGIFGLFVTVGSWPVIDRLLGIAEKLK